jgi:hypothetical protein
MLGARDFWNKPFVSSAVVFFPSSSLSFLKMKTGRREFGHFVTPNTFQYEFQVPHLDYLPTITEDLFKPFVYSYHSISEIL